MIFRAKDIRIIDSNCEELGISVIQLMENAGAAATKEIVKQYPKAEKVVVCCGTGNNGGDGMVVARHLASLGRKVTTILAGHEGKIRSQATKQNFAILKEMEQSVNIQFYKDSSHSASLKEQLEKADLIVDALLGIGLTSEPYEPIRSAILAINKSKKPVASLDIPSGMWSDSCVEPETIVNANLILTFHGSKPCLSLDTMKEKTIVCNIGVPPEAEVFVGKGDLKHGFPRRKLTSHKGENGMVLVIGGSKAYSGAPVLSSRAALRTGADLVITCIPGEIASSVRSDSPNMIVKQLQGEQLVPEHLAELEDFLRKFDTVVLGPGLGDGKESAAFVQKLMEKIPKGKAVVIDADAIKAVRTILPKLKDKKVVLTPHAGEFKALFGEAVADSWEERSKLTTKTAKKYGLTIILKGKYDIVSNGAQTKVNRTGHEGMTVGGTGDVLAGILGTILAINANQFEAACAAVYLTGKAGELAAEDFGNSLLATDVIEKIPEVLLNVSK